MINMDFTYYRLDLTHTPKSSPIEPYVNEDGWYTQCSRCWTEIQPSDCHCPSCGQKQDWTWFTTK